MNTDTIIEKVCRLPIDFYSGGSKSMVDLVSESGVSDHPSALASAEIVPYVRKHLEVVDQWLRWSANKRVDSGWYFERRRDHFLVGFEPNGDTLRFEDQGAACAEYIVREVTAIMKIHRRRA
jgi:hypothetical protein